MADNIGSLSDLYTKDPRLMSVAELQRIRDADDLELMRASATMHLAPIVESMRRLRETIRIEERAVRFLTWVLIFFTAALVALTAALVYLGYRQH